ncbi:hypothetical protein A3H26_02480 [candidate division WWE3 bacterium RIFCSPLOWO2_12_FULL_36_10]|uniref:Uncharacterized protein n=1 Tax=candidate division WWE3 bacterium RIFCSPLOWO2_12_FULL_36_10 TaxID=1802630 RepID=A0A1F4VIZ6_UNCKA|nr:MAG: hypothetical protein A3H26_02480 [candidate division WWE3 bacterium RIFCSPLOWO2_12_FULL_36_10]
MGGEKMTTSINWKIAVFFLLGILGLGLLGFSGYALFQTGSAPQTVPVTVRATNPNKIVMTTPCQPESVSPIGPIPEGVYQGQFIETTGLYLLVGDTWSACVESKDVVEGLLAATQTAEIPNVEVNPQQSVRIVKRILIGDMFRDWISSWPENNVTLLRFKQAFLSGNTFPLVALIFVNLGMLYITFSSCKEESQEGRYHVISYLILFLVIVNLYPILQLLGQSFLPAYFGWAGIGKQDQLWLAWGTGSWILSAVALAILVFLAFQIIRDTQHTAFPSGEWEKVLVASDEQLGELTTGSIEIRPERPPELDARSTDTPTMKNPGTGQEVKAKYEVEIMKPGFRFDTSATTAFLSATVVALMTWGSLPFLGFNRIFDLESGLSVINTLVVTGGLLTLAIMCREVYFEARYMRKGPFAGFAVLVLAFLPVTFPILIAPALVLLSNTLGGAMATGKEATAKGQAISSVAILLYLFALFALGYVLLYPANLLFGNSAQPPLFQAYTGWLSGFLGR